MNCLVYMRSLSSQIDTNYTQTPETASFPVTGNVHNPHDDTLSRMPGILAVWQIISMGGDRHRLLLLLAVHQTQNKQAPLVHKLANWQSS